jgi:stage III sporulation protein AH
MKKWSGFHIRWNKKVWTLFGVALLLCGAVVANIIIGNNADGQAGEQPPSEQGGEDVVSTGASGTQNFFAAFRADRDTTREKEIDYLDAIIEQGADQETLSDAQQQKLDIVTNMEKELTVESLLKAKGFADAAVTLHAGSVNVILSAESLTDEQVAQVLDIVMRETGEPAENVKVTTA